MVHSLLGKKKAAVQNIHKAVDKGYFPYPYFQIDSLLDPLRDDSSFLEVMELAKENHLKFKAAYFSYQD